MKKVVTALSISAVALALMSTPTAAQERRSACQGDVEKFCASVERKQGAMRQCLKEHESELSEECRSEVAATKEKMQGLMQACGSDIKSLCKGLKPGGGQILHCLKENRSSLSPDCANALPSGR